MACTYIRAHLSWCFWCIPYRGVLSGNQSAKITRPYKFSVKVNPQYCIAHLYCTYLTHDAPARVKKMAAFSLQLGSAIEVNLHFLENEYSDLTFFFDASIILCIPVIISIKVDK